MLPGVQDTDQDGSTGVAPQTDPTGIVAIIAASSDAVMAIDTPAMFTDQTTMQAQAGSGPLAELAAYFLAITGLPVVLVRVTGSGATYGAVDHTKVTGTAVPTAGGTTPLDTFPVQVKIGVGGVIGVTGITYTYSIDGGETWSPVQALGVAASIVIPGTGVTFTLTTTQTFIAGDLFTCTTVGPKVLEADIANATAALRATELPWDVAFVDGDADQTMISAVDAWLATLATPGEYKWASLNTRLKTVGEDEPTYATAMQAIRNAASSKYIHVAAEGCDAISPIRGVYMVRYAHLGIIARALTGDIARMASVPGDGPLEDIRITTPSGAPKYHNEQKNPGLDDMGFSTLRSIPRKSGAFNTLTRLFSPLGSDWVFVPHARVMNLAKQLAYDKLSAITSLGVHTQKIKNAQGQIVRVITEADAQKIEGLVNPSYTEQITGENRASAATFALSRSDDLSTNGPQTLTYEINVDALRYIGQFVGVSKFI
ncbi:MAG TPA: DUF2586 family protein [Polyangiaceae bacterium]|jgi:hypothetical protein